eukprot:3303640-Pyramimonas_sp.AAC.1
MPPVEGRVRLDTASRIVAASSGLREPSEVFGGFHKPPAPWRTSQAPPGGLCSSKGKQNNKNCQRP